MTEKIPPPEKKEEEPFDPHSVPSVDDSDINAPQYAPRDMQEGIEELEAKEQEAIDARIEAADAGIVLNPEDVPEYIKESLDAGETRAGWFKTLRELVGKFEGKSFKESLGYIGSRVKELDAALAPKAEKFAEKIGEAYNKLPLWQKITLGTALTVGYGFTLPVSTAAAGLFGGAMAIQRAFGLAGTFRSFEKKFEAVSKGEATGRFANIRLYKWLGSGSETGRKNKAMAGAVLYSLGMTGMMSLTAYELGQHHVGERLGEWIRSHMPGGETGAAATSSVVSEAAPSPQGHPGYETQNFENPEAPQPIAPDGEVPTAAQDFEAPEAPPIAEAPVQPEISAEVPIQPEASVEVPTAAPETVVPTPEVVAPEASAPEPISSPEITEGANVDIDDETRRKALEFVASSNPEAPSIEASTPIIEQVPIHEPASFGVSPVSIEPAAPEVVAPIEPLPTPALEQVTLSEQGPILTVDVIQNPEIPPVSVDDSIVQPAAQPEVSSVPSVEGLGPHEYLNSLGTPVDPDVPHIYESAKGVYVFGGDKALDAQAQDYALEHKVSVFVDKSFKNWLGWTTYRVIEYAPTKDGPLAMVIHNGASLVPDPKNFTKRVF